jgi:hypothetical protein
MKKYPTDQQLKDACRTIGQVIVVTISMMTLLTAVVSLLYLVVAPFFGPYDTCFGDQLRTGRIMAILFAVSTPLSCFAVPLAKRIIEIR